MYYSCLKLSPESWSKIIEFVYISSKRVGNIEINDLLYGKTKFNRALSMQARVKDVKEPTLLFVKSRERRPRWCSTEPFMGWGVGGNDRRVDIKWDERPVPSPVTVANSVKYLANSYRR